jgi:hypothetical protein
MVTAYSTVLQSVSSPSISSGGSVAGPGLVVYEWCTMAAARFSVRVRSFVCPSHHESTVRDAYILCDPTPPSYEVGLVYNPKYATLHLGGSLGAEELSTPQSHVIRATATRPQITTPFKLKPLVINSQQAGNLSIQAWGKMDRSS